MIHESRVLGTGHGFSLEEMNVDLTIFFTDVHALLHTNRECRMP